MANGGRIDWTLGFKVDKTGLNDAKIALQNLKTGITPTDLFNMNPGKFKNISSDARKALSEIKQDIESVQTAFNQAFDTTTGQMNLTKLNTSLKQLDINKIYNSFSMLGKQGEQAFYKMTKAALSANTQFLKTKSVLDSIGQTLLNTLKWNISSSLINRFTGSIQQAYGYVQHLDSSLNDIRIVTGKSADEMERFAVKANKAAQNLGKSTTEYTEASLIYYQQGLSDEETAARTETTLKAANVTGQSAQAVSEQLTAVWNGYRVSAENTEQAVDKLAAVAATTAADLEELSTGMSKVASAANSMGVDMDQLNATIATIESVTRQAPESVGTALKTIYARMGDLKLGDTDEDGLKLGDVSSTLQKVGIDILDVNGELRDMGVVIEEIGDKWGTWTKAQQTAIAESVAGKRQYNNLFALFDNWDMYNKALETSRDSTGTLQQQQDIYMESTAAHIQQLKTQWEDLYDSLLDEKSINKLLSGLTSALSLFTNFIDSIGGSGNVLLLLGSTFTKVFQKQIGVEIGNAILKMQQAKDNAQQLAAQVQNIELFKNSQGMEITGVKELVNAYNQIKNYYGILNEEGLKQADILAQQVAEAAVLKEQFEENTKLFNTYVQTSGTSGVSTFDIVNNRTSTGLKVLDENSQQDLDLLKEIDGLFRNIDADAEDFANSFLQQSERTNKGFKQWRDSLSQVDADYSGLTDDIQVNFLSLDRGITQIYGDFKKLSSGLKTTIPELNAVDEAFEQMNKASSKAAYDKAVRKFIQAVIEAVPKAKQLLGEMQRLRDQAPEMAASFESAKQSLNNFLHAEAVKTFAKNLTGLVGNVGQLASGLLTLKNIGNILTNESLSMGEKILQLISSFGMGFTMVFSNITQIAHNISALGPSISAMAAKIIENAMALKVEEGSIWQNAKARKAQIIAQREEEKERAKNAAAAVAEDLAVGSETTAEVGNVGASSANAKTKMTLTGAIYAHIKALIAEKIAQALANPVMAVAKLAVVGLAAAITGLILTRQKHLKAIKEENENIIKSVEKYEEESQKTQDLLNSYHDLIDEYRNGSISVEEFKKKRQELLKVADFEIQAALEVADTWEKASKAFDDYQNKKLDRDIEEAEAKRNAGLSSAYQAGATGSGGYDKDTRSYTFAGGYDVTGSDFQKALVEELGFGDFVANTLQLDFSLNPDEESFQKLEKLGALLEQFKDTDVKNDPVYQALKEEYGQITGSKDYVSALEGQNDIDDATLQKAATNSAIYYAKTEEELQQAQEKFFAELEDSGLTYKEKMDAWLNTLNNTNTETAQKEASKKKNIYNMISPWAEDYKKYISEDQSIWQTNYAKEAERIYGLLEENQLTEGINLVDWKSLISIKDDQEILNEVKQAIQDNIKVIEEEFKANIGTTSDNLGSVISKAIIGDLTGDDEVYQQLGDQLDKVKSLYPDLIDEIQTFNNEGLIGTEHWINSVYKLQDAIDKIEYDTLIQKSDEAREKLDTAINGTTEYRQVEGGRVYAVNVEADDSKFQEAMNEIMNAEYAIDVEVHSDADRDFNRLVSSLDQADEMASKIGEDFVVAADDIRDLNNAFPGILEGIEYLGDGTIKLNEEVVQSAMAAASQEEAADTKKTITKLHNAATELRAKAETYDAVADIAAKAAKDENYAEQAKVDAKAQLQELETENNKIKSNIEIENAVAVTDNSQENAGIMAANWTQAYQAAAEASYQFAMDAVNNAEQVAKGPDGKPQQPNPSNYGVNYTGNSGAKASEAVDATGQFKKADDTVDWSAMEQSYREMAESARAKANDIEGMIVAAAAKGTEVLNKNVDASKGRPKDEDGSGSDSSKDADHEEYLEREEDIYRTINEELEQIESTLGRIQTINDHEWGIDAQKTLEEENKLLDEQLKKLEEKKQLQLDDLATRRKQLEDVGIEFSDDGSAMLNAENELNKLYAQYNSMVDYYNSLSADAQEIYKAELEAEKAKIDVIEKKMDEYESGFSDYQSTLDEILDTHYAAIENEVNQFNNMVDVHLELKDAEKEWNDFWKEVVEDVQETDFAGQIAASLKQLDTLVGTPFTNADSTVKTLTNHLNETVAEVQAQMASADRGGEDSIFGDDTLASKENLEKYRDSLMEALRSAKGEVDNISENYLKILDDAQDKIDKQVEGWNSVGDQIEHDVELIKLISGDKAFDALNKQYDQQYKNDLNLINTQKQSQDFWKQQIERYQKLVNTTDSTTVQWKTYNESLNKAVENYRKATADLNKSVEESIKNLQTWRENNVKAITDTLDKAMSGGLGLSNIEQEWKLINDYADQYYDNVERAFNMEDYTNILDDAANAIGLSAENQAKLNNFRKEELAQLNAKNKLTQYDIDESKARLEILKAEIALQDTQRNKSNMRLRRDNQGNYVYQYTGDEEEQDKAENGLLTARREWYELVKRRNKETNDYIIQLGKERIDLQTQLAEAQLEGDTERINLLLKLIEQNEQQQVFAYEQAENAKRDLIKGTAQYFADVENHDVLPMWDTTINHLVDKWAVSEDSFIKASIKAVKDLQAVQDEYALRTKAILEEAGINYQKLKDEGIDPTKDSVEDLVDSNEDLADALETVNGLLNEQEGNLKKAEEAYLSLKQAAVDAIMAANQALNQLSQTTIQYVHQVQAAVSAAQSAASMFSAGLRNGVGRGGSESGTEKGASANNKGSSDSLSGKSKFSLVRDPYGVSGKQAIRNNETGQYVKIVDNKQLFNSAGLSASQIAMIQSSGFDEEFYKKYFLGFATGGYTGSWGKDGKLAVLHEKELVLNKDDTTNILKAVEMIRQVAQLSSIGNNLLNASMTSNNMLAKLNAGILQGTNSFNTNTNSNKNMSMVINADFSGVRSADEIYQALLELQNYGLQENYSVAPHMNISY